jgi:hypothetical protein
MIQTGANLAIPTVSLVKTVKNVSLASVVMHFQKKIKDALV